jgi:RNA recognition motif-containing protein
MHGNGGEKIAAGIPNMTSKLYVGNLPFATTAQELQNLFAQDGAVSAVDLVFDKFTGRSRGFAFVNMATPQDAHRVIEKFHGYDMGGRNLTVNEARPREEYARASEAAGERRDFSDSPQSERSYR